MTDAVDLLDLVQADDADRRWVEHLLAQPLSSSAHAVIAALLVNAEVPASVSAEDGAAAVFHLVPHIVERLSARGVPDDVIASTVGDLGRHLRRHRAVTGDAGLLNWSWFAVHISGNLLEVGRLQYEVASGKPEVPDAFGPWVLKIHIPALSGPLLPELVDASLQRGAIEVRRAWPDIAVSHAVCESWLLDPYLADHLTPSNISSFAGRFTPYAEPFDEPTDPLFFLWGHRDAERMPEHPSSRLERVVAERIRAGGTWQAGRGALLLSTPPR